MSDNTPGVTLTHSQSINRLREITAELERLGELNELTREDETYFAELSTEFDAVDSHRKRLERAADLERVRAAANGLNGGRRVPAVPGSQSSADEYDRDAILEPDSIEDHRFRDPWNLRDMRVFGRDAGDVNAELQSRALDAIEKMPSATPRVRETATHILERFDADGRLAKLCLATSSPVYLRAWSKMAGNQQHTLTVQEQDALQQVRAMSLTDNAGGYLVPFQLDPTVIITSNGSRNDIRRFARQVVAVGDVWNGVSSAAVSWSWDAEGAEVSDDAPTLAQPAIPIYKAAGFVPVSIEAAQDMQNGAQEIARLLAAGKDDLEAAAFATGSGVGQPTGIVTALTGGSSVVASAAADTLAIGDIYALQGALPARYRSNAAWLSTNATYNKIRQFDTNGGAGLWETIGADRPAALLGRPVGEAEAMDGVITAGADNYMAVYGDFQNYVIADRIGMTVEFIPHLFHTGNNRPSGSRGWYAYYRVGADSVNDGAFRMLNVT